MNIKESRLPFIMLFIAVLIRVSVVYGSNEATDAKLCRLIATKWGNDNVLLPTPTMLVQYEDDLGERWVVDYEKGMAKLECLWLPERSAGETEVVNAMICAVSNLFIHLPRLPQQMLEQQMKDGNIPAEAASREIFEYVVRPGDTLSQIADHFRVPIKEIMLFNGITDPHRIRAGAKLTIPPAPPHIHLSGEELRAVADESILEDQVRDPDSNELVTRENIGVFSEKLARNGAIKEELITGADGKKRKVTSVSFNLAANHLEVRARRFYPMILAEAQRFSHDPAVIMAIIHTESAFNPQAASAANAYGLMQVVPSTGGREAYRWLHSKDVAPSPEYLLKPRQNLELGNAYLRILKDHVFAGVNNPQSRLYCAVAAYNGGSLNVGEAFTGKKSVQQSIREINKRSPAEVQSILENRAPYKETRDYIKKVFERAMMYSTPAWQS